MKDDSGPDFNANQRLIILRALAATDDKRMNETMLNSHLDHFGYRLGRDDVRDLLKFLSDAAAIRTVMAGGVIMIAELLQRGQDHLDRRGGAIPGVDLPSLR